MYALDKKVLTLMVVTFILTTASATIVMTSIFSGHIIGCIMRSFTFISAMLMLGWYPGHAHLIPGMPFCDIIGVSTHFYAVWIPPLIQETLLLGLALFRGFKKFFSDAPAFRSGHRLVEILIRDSILYFVVYVHPNNVQL